MKVISGPNQTLQQETAPGGIQKAGDDALWVPQREAVRDLENSYSMVTPFSKSKENQGITKVQRINSPVFKRLYTLKGAAEYLGRSEWSMRELIWAGRIPIVRNEKWLHSTKKGLTHVG